MFCVLGREPNPVHVHVCLVLGLSPRQHLGLHLNADELLVIITQFSSVEDFIVACTIQILIGHVPLLSSFFGGGRCATRLSMPCTGGTAGLSAPEVGESHTTPWR